jgi:hypothetical protein
MPELGELTCHLAPNPPIGSTDQGDRRPIVHHRQTTTPP